MRNTTMCYDHKFDRWSVRFGDKNYGLHCGETFDLMIYGGPISCRLELREAWYVVADGVGLGLQPSEVYKIRI